MRKIVTAIMLFAVVLLSAVEPRFMKDSAISPDGKTVCFTYMSDLWLVPFEGGEARRITVTDADDRNPLYSPDGKWIAFTSNRDGFNGVYLIPSDGGEAKLLSRDINTVCDWYNDSQSVLGTRYEHGTGTGLYIAYLDGRRPKEVAPIGHHFSKLSPDNKKIIFPRNGMPERPAYQGSMKGDLWEYDIKKKSYKKLTDTELTERYPIFSHKNPYVYYSASDGNLFQLFRVKNYDFINREQLTTFTDWSVRDLYIARENDRITFEKFDELWRYDPVVGKPEKIEITIKQDYLSNYDITENYKNKAKGLTISPDGKLIVFSYKFDLFAYPEKGGEVKQLTFDKKGIADIIILPDNQTIYFMKREQGYFQLFSLNIKEPEKINKVQWFEGKYVTRIYQSDEERLMVHYEAGEDRWKAAFLDTKTGKIEEFLPDKPVWSNLIPVTKDKRYAFYVVGEPEIWSRHLNLYDFKTKKVTPLLDNLGYIGNMIIGKDNKSLLFTYGSNLARLDFQPISDYHNEKDNWLEILEQETKENKKDEKKGEKKGAETLNILFEGLKDRLTIISSRPGFNYPIHAIDDSTMYYLNNNNNSYSLRKIDYYGRKDEEVLSFSGDMYSMDYNESTNTIYLSLDDTPYKASLSGRKLELLPNSFEYEYNPIELNKRVFDELWVEFGRFFYDYKMHGKDWSEMYRRYYPYLDYSYTTEYFSFVVDEMIGELNASHTGFYPRERNRKYRPIAYPGLVFDFSKPAKKGIYVKKAYSPSTLAKVHNIKEGDLLLTVDGVNIDEYTSIESLFVNKVGKKIKMEFQTSDGLKKVEIKGPSYYEEYQMYYKDWIDSRKELVTKLSKGRLGYLHIQRMDQESLEKFKQELFAENFNKEGIVIDIRFNGGGNISSELLDILTRTQRAYTTTRGYQDQMFATPRNIWQKPTALVINEGSFSDAEIFPLLFKQLGIGKVVGMPTSGGVIGTTPYELMDGSSMRLPRSGWYTLDGVDMEGLGATPDIMVDLTPEQIIKDDDEQLKKAVEALLEELKQKK